MNNENNNLNQGTNNVQSNPIHQTYNNSTQQQINVNQNNEINNMQQSIQQQNIQAQSASIVSVQTRKIHKSAIISLVCSVVSLFIFWWLAFVGIGLGIRALNEIKTTGEKGKTLVIISIILAIICAILYFSQILLK